MSPEGTSKLPLPLRKPSRCPPPHVLKVGAAGQRRAGIGSGLRAWEPRAGRCPPAQIQGRGALGAHLTCYVCSPGAARRGASVLAGAKQGGNHRHLLRTAPLAESCELPAAGAQSRSTKVRYREAVAGSAPPGPALRPRLASRPRPSRPRPVSRPRPSPRASQPPGPPSCSAPAPWSLRLRVSGPAPSERPSH